MPINTAAMMSFWGILAVQPVPVPSVNCTVTTTMAFYVTKDQCEANLSILKHDKYFKALSLECVENLSTRVRKYPMFCDGKPFGKVEGAPDGDPYLGPVSVEGLPTPPPVSKQADELLDKNRVAQGYLTGYEAGQIEKKRLAAGLPMADNMPTPPAYEAPSAVPGAPTVPRLVLPAMPQ